MHEWLEEEIEIKAIKNKVRSSSSALQKTHKSVKSVSNEHSLTSSSVTLSPSSQSGVPSKIFPGEGGGLVFETLL